VLGGPHTFNLVWASSRFVEANPKIVTALVAALEDAMQRIKTDPKAAAELWIKAENVKMPVEDAVAIISNPQNEWTTTPKKMLAYLDYMNRAGLVSTKTDDWKELFFPNIQNAQGS